MLLVVDNEVDPDYGYFLDAARRYLPDHRVHVAGDGFASLDDLGDVDGVVLGGSTAGVYESNDYPWMDDERALVRRLVTERIPTLGVCFGHQLVNDALGGRVRHRGLTAEFVDATLAADPLFEGVSPRLPMVHGDAVVETGEEMVPIASADYYEALATTHRDAPLWSVQFHPEFTAALHPRIEADFGWHDDDTFADVTAHRVYENFARLVATR